MKKLVNINSENDAYQTRHEIVKGIEYIVIPTVMMVEGVHSGNKGPLLHTISELGKFPQSWDGIPIVINHPEVNGIAVSANSPVIREQEVIGTVFNTKVLDDKLKAEAWVEIDTLRQKSPSTLQKIQNKELMEVSVGVFSDEIEEQGVWKNEQYIAVAKNHRPDHLALLPDAVGACSISDGCGLRVNKREGGNEMKKEEIKKLITQGLSTMLVTNEVSMQALVSTIAQKLDALDTDTHTYYLQELFKDYFVYEVSSRNLGQDNEIRQRVLYRLNYTVDDDGVIEFVGEPSKVQRKVEYINVNQKIQRTKGVKIMAEKKETPCCPDVVDGLIANQLSNFTKDDKEWLLTQSKETIDKLQPKAPETPENVQVNKEDIKGMIKESMKSEADFLEMVPSEYRDSFASGLELNKQAREKMVSNILDNSKNIWNKEELEVMNTNMLTKISDSIKPVGNYVGLGANERKEMNINSGEILLPLGVQVNKEKGKEE